MKGRDIMRRPVQTLDAGATVQAAAEKMLSANIGLIPICDSRAVPVGVLTDRDIALRVVARGLAPTTACEAVMTREIVSCLADDDIEIIARKMARNRKSRILVIDGERLAGIISISDLTSVDLSIAAMALHDVAAREILQASGHLSPAP